MIYTEKILYYTWIYWNFDDKIPLISLLSWRMFTFQKGSLRNKQLSVNETLTLADSSAPFRRKRQDQNIYHFINIHYYTTNLFAIYYIYRLLFQGVSAVFQS